LLVKQALSQKFAFVHPASLKLRRAGKALFEEGAILKAAFWGLLIGPIVSFVGGGALLGIIVFGLWIFEKVYNWYAPDLGLQRLDCS
jgi:hypothetical protein